MGSQMSWTLLNDKAATTIMLIRVSVKTHTDKNREERKERDREILLKTKVYRTKTNE